MGDRLVLICLVGLTVSITLLISDLSKNIRTRMMVKRTIRNCFRIIEDMES